MPDHRLGGDRPGNDRAINYNLLLIIIIIVS